jgi:hypothetical protein
VEAFSRGSPELSGGTPSNTVDKHIELVWQAQRKEKGRQIIGVSFL